MQMFSDILGLPVEISKAKELDAMGVAMEAAVGTGLFADIAEAAEHWVKIKAVYYPDSLGQPAARLAFLLRSNTA